jgi:hypothetical protein
MDRRAVGLADIFGQAYGGPVSAHHLAHRCIAFYPAQQFIFFCCEHFIS